MLSLTKDIKEQTIWVEDGKVAGGKRGLSPSTAMRTVEVRVKAERREAGFQTLCKPACAFYHSLTSRSISPFLLISHIHYLHAFLIPPAPLLTHAPSSKQATSTAAFIVNTVIPAFVDDVVRHVAREIPSVPVTNPLPLVDRHVLHLRSRKYSCCSVPSEFPRSGR